jgi:hypothetical protein
MVLRKKLNAIEMKKGDYVMTYLETFQSMLNQLVTLVVLRSYKKKQARNFLEVCPLYGDLLSQKWVIHAI